MTWGILLAWTCIAPLAMLSCNLASADVPAVVYYAIDAPLCSSRIPVELLIDGTQVGTDTFVVNLAPEHKTSRGFLAMAGSHTVGARVPGGYVWPDRGVALTAGQVFTDSLPFYCS